jgi:hypothetical protein
MMTSKEDKIGGACSTHGEKRNAYRVFGGKARRKETTKKTCTWMEDNIKNYLRETGWGDMDWTNLIQYSDQWHALVMVMGLRVP